MDKRYNILFIGFSGSGKDTQAHLVENVLRERSGKDSVLYIYTGEHLREAVKKGGHTGQYIQKKVMEAGNKAPDYLAIWAWGNDLVHKMLPEHHLIFSGSPRTRLEAVVLDDAFVFYDRPHVYPIYLNVARDEAFRRLKERKRADDTDDTINNRLDYFERIVIPAVEYYRSESVNGLIEIDGNPHDQEKIHQDILRAIELK